MPNKDNGTTGWVVPVTGGFCC
jgi:hypothetical protein